MPLHDSSRMMELMNIILPYADENCNVREDAPEEVKLAAEEYIKLASEQEMSIVRKFVKE